MFYDAYSACMLLLVAAHSFASFVLLVKANLCLIILAKESESGHVIMYSISSEIVIMSYWFFYTSCSTLLTAFFPCTRHVTLMIAKFQFSHDTFNFESDMGR